MTPFVCKLCRGREIGESYTLNDRGQFPAVRCAECGLFQDLYAWWEGPPLNVMSAYDGGSRDDLWASGAEQAAKRDKGAMLARLLDAHGLLKNARVLDIGCGDGFFLDACRGLGAAGVTGQEFRNADIIHARERLGIPDVRSVPIDDRGAWPDSEFDVVCSFDVLEHVHDLKRFLEDCMRVARPGGVLYHATPGFDSVAGRLGRLIVRQGALTLGTTLCNLQRVSDMLGGPHVSILGVRTLGWIARRYGWTLLRAQYASSYTYSDRHYASLVPGLRRLPRAVGSAVFRLARSTVRNKLVFMARVKK